VTGHRIVIKGFRLKDGKVIRDPRRLDVSAQRRIAGSKRVRVKRRGAP